MSGLTASCINILLFSSDILLKALCTDCDLELPPSHIITFLYFGDCNCSFISLINFLGTTKKIDEKSPVFMKTSREYKYTGFLLIFSTCLKEPNLLPDPAPNIIA